MEGKETDANSKMETNKRQKQGRGREEESDRLSELPDCVLLHILRRLDAKHVVQTCVLSKRWKDLWRGLPILEFNSYSFDNVANFNKFVSHVLSFRDDSISLTHLVFTRLVDPKLFNRLMKYAVLHNVQWLRVNIFLEDVLSFEFLPYIFNCRSLRYLKILISSNKSKMVLPESLEMPALERLQLVAFTFAASVNGYAEPFSKCNRLKSLILEDCWLHKDAKFLSISNSNLSILIITGIFRGGDYKISLSTPNLSSLTFMGHNIKRSLSTANNLSYLEEVTIDASCSSRFQNIINLRQVLSNAYVLTLSFGTVDIIPQDLSNPVSMSGLKSLRVSKRIHGDPVEEIIERSGSDELVKRVVEYLLQNSPLARVDVTVSRINRIDYSIIFW